MCADEYFDLTLLKLFKCFFFFFRRSEAIDIINGNREIFQAVRKCLVMLKSEDGGRHQDGSLFAIDTGLKCRSYGHLCLSKTYIAANQPIHWRSRFHIFLYIRG